MSTLRISDAPLLPDVDGTEKIPTGGRGDYAVSINQITEFARGGIPQQLENHINDKENPHDVTKEQVGLGNVDNTSDIDKPVSSATQSTLDTKADKSTVYTKLEIDGSLSLKADKGDTYTKSQVDAAVSSVAGGGYGYATLAEAQAATTTLPIQPNSIVTVTNDTTLSNNGDYQWNGTTLTKSAYDPLTQAKADATTKVNAAEANAKNYTDNATEPKLLSGLDIYYKAKENPAKLFQAIWQEYNKPVWYIGNNTFVDTTGASLSLVEPELVFTIKLTEANQTFIYPTRANTIEGQNATVDWGDGVVTEHSSYVMNHTYAGEIGAEFQIKVKGNPLHFDFSVANGSRRTSRLMLKSIDKNTMPAMTYFSIDGCENIKSLGQGAFSSFAGTTLKIMYIPDWSNVTLHKNAFLGLSQVTNIDSLFGDSADLVIPSGLFDSFVNVTSAARLFYRYKKTSLPTGIFDKMVNLENVSFMFYASLLTSIDNRIFKNQTKLTNVSQCFRLSSSLVADAYQLYTDMNQGSPATVNGCLINVNAMTNLASVPAAWKTL